MIYHSIQSDDYLLLGIASVLILAVILEPTITFCILWILKGSNLCLIGFLLLAFCLLDS